VENATPRPEILEPEEIAVATRLIALHQATPFPEPTFRVADDGSVIFENLPSAVYLLNQYRPVLHNQGDPTYYTKVHNIVAKLLRHQDPRTGTLVRADGKGVGDVTAEYLNYLGRSKNGIELVLRDGEFDYLYNGVLQHADLQHSTRFAEDWYSGGMNHLILKHGLLVGLIRELLVPYLLVYRCFVPGLKLGDV
jgi:hypothetical protein